VFRREATHASPGGRDFLALADTVRGELPAFSPVLRRVEFHAPVAWDRPSPSRETIFYRDLPIFFALGMPYGEVPAW